MKILGNGVDIVDNLRIKNYAIFNAQKHKIQ